MESINLFGHLIEIMVIWTRIVRMTKQVIVNFSIVKDFNFLRVGTVG